MDAETAGNRVGAFEDAAPMAQDRTLGWQYYTSRGDVFDVDGHWYLTSAEAVRFALQHPDVFSSARAFDALGSPVPLIPLAIDRPDHVRYRRLLDPMLAPRVIAALKEDLRRQLNGLIDGFAERGHCELITELATPYPSQVIMTLFGLPLEDRDKFLEWNRLILEAQERRDSEPTPEQAAGGLALFEYLAAFIDAKREHPADDLISSILTLEGDDEWTPEELLGLCFLFVLAGLDTVAGAIGFTMLELARNPELRNRVAADTSLIAPVVEEVLRLELPAPVVPRVTTADVEVAGALIPAGAHCSILLAAANRDERERGGSPDEVDLEHADLGHLSFGGGIHRCLGSHLARAELYLVVEEFLRRIPDFQLAEGFTPEIVWPSGTHHLASLPLEWGTAR